LSHPSLDLSESSLSSESFEAGLLALFSTSADPFSESSSDSPESSLSSESSEAGLLAVNHPGHPCSWPDYWPNSWPDSWQDTWPDSRLKADVAVEPEAVAGELSQFVLIIS
jgi:hypothetical protein